MVKAADKAKLRELRAKHQAILKELEDAEDSWEIDELSEEAEAIEEKIDAVGKPETGPAADEGARDDKNLPTEVSPERRTKPEVQKEKPEPEAEADPGRPGTDPGRPVELKTEPGPASTTGSSSRRGGSIRFGRGR